MGTAELLARSGMFRALDERAVAEIAASARAMTLRRGDVLFAEGDEANELYLVRAGRIAIGMRSVDGRESVVGLVEAGDLFGDIPLFDGQGRSLAARALEATELIAVPYPPIREVLQRRPELLWNVVELMVRRLRDVDAALADSMFLDVTGRTAKRLLELAGDRDEFVLPLTQEELAGMVGASRERVNKAIAAFVRLGWIEQEDRNYRITNRAEMEKRSS